MSTANTTDKPDPAATSETPKKDDIAHRPYEDVLALLLGTMVVSLGVTLYSESILVTGSTAGAALLIEHATGLSFGVIFFVINLPFYWLAFKRMGKAFTIKTFIAVGLVSAFSKLTPMLVEFNTLNPIYAAVAGGCVDGDWPAHAVSPSRRPWRGQYPRPVPSGKLQHPRRLFPACR